MQPNLKILKDLDYLIENFFFSSLLMATIKKKVTPAAHRFFRPDLSDFLLGLTIA